MKELLTVIIENIENFELNAQFRKGQKPFYDAIINGLKKDWKTMYIEGPTGMGKTFIEAVLAAAIIGKSDIKILLLTSKITLLQQIQREFKKFVGFLNTGLFGGGFKNYSEQVTIMTYASFLNLDEGIAQRYSVLLLDEGHKGLGEKTKAKLERQKKFSLLIGFTASAEYSTKKSLENFLENLAYKLSIEQAVELGMLSNIKVMIASVDIEISNRKEGQSKGDYEEQISSDIIRQGGNIATARLYKRVFAKRNLRGICLVLTKNQGNDLVEQFALGGVKAELIHSGLKRVEREEMFARFRNNEFSVLVGMEIIKEGFDDPGVSVAITTYPIFSRVVMTQFPGRAERIDEENPDKVAYVVNLAYKSKKQLFYTNILDGKSEIVQKKKREQKLDIISRTEMRSAIARNPESFITSVAVSEEEVKELIRSYESIEFLLYQELKLAVQKAGIDSYMVYSKEQKNHDNWPSHLGGTYKDEYSFEDFFVSKFLPYQKLKLAVQKAGIDSLTVYIAEQKNHDNWASNPGRIYKDEYSFEDFFVSKFLPYQELKLAVQKAEIKDRDQYGCARKNHTNWPSSPWERYVDKYSSDDFFGSKFLSYSDLRTAVQKAGIDSTTVYSEEQRNHDSWPSNLRSTYKDEYSFDDFFGSKFLPYQELKLAVQKAGIKDTFEYNKIQKKHSNWPSSPGIIYKDEYPHEDFFVSKFLSYSDLRTAVQKAGINSTRVYLKEQKNHDDWKSRPWVIYKDKYSFEDFFGKKK